MCTAVAVGAVLLAVVTTALAVAAMRRRNGGRRGRHGHSLTIDHGWQEVAQTALDFVKRFVPAKPS